MRCERLLAMSREIYRMLSSANLVPDTRSSIAHEIQIFPKLELLLFHIKSVISHIFTVFQIRWRFWSSQNAIQIHFKVKYRKLSHFSIKINRTAFLKFFTFFFSLVKSPFWRKWRSCFFFKSSPSNIIFYIPLWNKHSGIVLKT